MSEIGPEKHSATVEVAELFERGYVGHVGLRRVSVPGDRSYWFAAPMMAVRSSTRKVSCAMRGLLEF